MAEINYNNLYNQLSPMEQRYYDQQFSKNYVPGQENIMLSSQPAYEQMKAAYEAEQQIPESSIFDSIFGSASAAEMPQVPNLTYRNITPTFDLGTGITNTKAASPFKIGLSDTLNQYNVPGLRSQDLINQLVEQNRQRVVSDFINAPQDYYPSYSGIGSMRYKTPRTIADQNRVLGQTFTEEEPSGIQKLFKTAMRFAVPGLSFLQNIAGGGQPYQQFTPGGRIKNGIYNIDGVNVPVSSFGGDFYNPNTGLNRFDRAAQRFTKTGSMLDLFGSSRTGKEFFEKRRQIQAQKQKALEDAAKAKIKFKQDTGGGGDGGFGGSRRGDADISDSQRGGFATDDTAGFF
jgi:hypothetical protein